MDNTNHCPYRSLVIQILEESFLDSTTTTPIYFILSPGANVVGDLDKLADKYEFVKNESYHNVSMGQGQVKRIFKCKIERIRVASQFCNR